MTLATVCPTQIVLAGYTFTFAALIEPKRSAGRGYIAYQPHSRYSRFGIEPLNPHGLGPFCKFSISGLPHDSGIYVFVVDSVPRYVGRTVDFASRMGPVNYGSISPKNCYRSGQSTNCKINSRVLRAVTAGQTVALYILSTRDLAIERDIIRAAQPAWNGRMA